MQEAYLLHQQGRLADAQGLYQQILSVYPNNANANYLLGMLMYSQGIYDACESFFLKASAAAPNDLKILMGLGTFLHKTNQYKAAAEVFQKMTKLAPRDLNALYNLGATYIELDKFSEAEACYEKFLDINPQHSGALSNMGNALVGLCEIEKACVYYAKALEHDDSPLINISNELLTSNNRSSLSSETIFQKHVEGSKYFPPADTILKRPYSGDRKIRIGYFSADFRSHSVAYFLWPLISNHDRSRFEVYCYYNNDTVDSMTQKIRSCSDKWLRTVEIGDDTLVSLIREHQIDIMIDLSGHTGHNRLPVLSRRVAPIQITWLGYPHSTGIKSMDYRVVDNITDPAPYADKLSTEKLIRLPQGFLCYDGNTKIPYNSKPPFLSKGFVTFGSFNNLAKVSRDVVNIWIDIINAVPESRIVLKAKQLGEKSVRMRYLSYFEDAGISSDRVELLAFVPNQENHLSLYNQIDIALDPFPYNGTTTTCESLWMGVPTITFLGDRHASRVGASIMTHAGYSEFVTEDVSSYKQLAIELGNRPNRLADIRSSMRKTMIESDLCNALQFTKNIEGIFQEVLSETNCCQK